MSGYLIEFFVYTMGITGILVAGFIFSKKFLVSHLSPFIQGVGGKINKRKICLEECFRLDPTKALYIVSVDSERYFIGSTGQSLSLLSVLEKKLPENSNITENTAFYNPIKQNPQIHQGPVRYVVKSSKS